MKQTDAHAGQDAAQRITQHIAELGGWRGPLLARLRALIAAAAPEITEEWKWETPVFALGGNLVAIGAFKDHIKLNFFKGAALDDPHRLFNAGFEAKATRAIDIREGDLIDEAALQELVRAAVALNQSGRKKTKP